ncbi:Glycosyl transferase family 2 [Symmachiella macrocystis]|uniref:Glycosyl transferase family 2 n=1 Tax=Symmachiella macrocystis TaxID=2527985 RepID=A0A5C6BJQ5_9PLAN|nr:glycosyltransferase [Symmachiella macrocystis]TWU11972.1 Glycosyl transferase family 2 [Symmachiella macrocystis]
MLDTTIIIPQRGHADLTRHCLTSFREQDPAAWPVVIVDDGSPQTAAGLSVGDLSPGRLILQPHRGVSAAWNRGAAAARTPFLVFLNNDTISTGPWVDELVRPLRQKECVLTGVAMRIERALPASLLDRLAMRNYLAGWCFAIAASVFHELGGFDESLRVYWSDTDLQLRAASAADDSREVLRDVAGLPLVHLGHRTAHDGCLLPRQREQWCADRQVFIAKWQQLLAGGLSGLD